MKKKTIQKHLAWLLSAAMLLTGVPAQYTQAAGAVKLSSKKLTINVGKTKTITLKNNKKKTKWKIVSGKKCIKLSKKKKNSVKIAAL
ncbi:hypothetical protein [Jutongia sp.]